MMTLCEDGHDQVAYNDDGECPVCHWMREYDDKLADFDGKCSELEDVQNEKDELVQKVAELKDRIDELESPDV